MPLGTTQELVNELRRLYEEEDRGPFPYDDCRYLLQNNDERFEDLIPDLDTYFWGIARCCSSPWKLLKLSKEQLREIQGSLTTTFFEEYPQYRLLERQIDEVNTPDLHENLALYEKMRVMLLELLSILIHEQNSD